MKIEYHGRMTSICLAALGTWMHRLEFQFTFYEAAQLVLKCSAYPQKNKTDECHRP